MIILMVQAELGSVGYVTLGGLFAGAPYIWSVSGMCPEGAGWWPEGSASIRIERGADSEAEAVEAMLSRLHEIAPGQALTITACDTMHRAADVLRLWKGMR